MKTPRVADFDPNAAPSLHSAMDNLPPIKPPQPAARPQNGQEPTPLPKPPAVKPVPKPEAKPKPAQQSAMPVIGDGFDINAERDARGTFELTAFEYDRLAELKRPLARQLGIKLSLHDLVRCGVNMLLADYDQHKDRSFLVRHLKQKKTK